GGNPETPPQAHPRPRREVEPIHAALPRRRTPPTRSQPPPLGPPPLRDRNGAGNRTSPRPRRLPGARPAYRAGRPHLLVAGDQLTWRTIPQRSAIRSGSVT